MKNRGLSFFIALLGVLAVVCLPACFQQSQVDTKLGASRAPLGTYRPGGLPLSLGRPESTDFKSWSIGASSYGNWFDSQLALTPSGSSPPTIDGVAPANGHGNNPTVVPGLATVKVGDLLIIPISTVDFVDTITWGLPSGWSTTGTGCTTRNNGCWAWKIAASGDNGATYSFSGAGGVKGQLIEVGGANSPSSNPMNANFGASGIPTSSALITSSANNLILNWVSTGSNICATVPPVGWQLVIDPTTHVNPPAIDSVTNTQGGVINPFVWSSGCVDGFQSYAVFQKVQASAGTVAAATSYAGFPVFAYSGGGGEIDRIGEIFQNGSQTLTLTMVRDGETTPSIDHIQIHDLTGNRSCDGSGVQHGNDYEQFGCNLLSSGRTFDAITVPMPWVNSMQGWVTNTETGTSSTIWSTIDFHTNNLNATDWSNRFHHLIGTNSTYPSMDTVAAYSEQTLLDVAGAGSLYSVQVFLKSHDFFSFAAVEGGVKIRIDGESNPSVYATGYEDWLDSAFNAAGLTSLEPIGTNRFFLSHYVNPTGVVTTTQGVQNLAASSIAIVDQSGFGSSGSVQIGSQQIAYTSLGASTTTSGVVNLAASSIAVASTTGFAPSGTFQVGAETITYTGTSGGNTFTGCTGGSGSSSNNQAVAQAVLVGCTGGAGSSTNGQQVVQGVPGEMTGTRWYNVDRTVDFKTHLKVTVNIGYSITGNIHFNYELLSLVNYHLSQ